MNEHVQNIMDIEFNKILRRIVIMMATTFEWQESSVSTKLHILLYFSGILFLCCICNYSLLLF